jgi:hypothetical protein
MNATVGSAGGDNLSRAEGIKRSNGVLKGFLHRGLTMLALPAMERRSVVLKAKGNPLEAPLAHTNSMMAISALSPRRRTVRMIRV